MSGFDGALGGVRWGVWGKERGQTRDFWLSRSCMWPRSSHSTSSWSGSGEWGSLDALLFIGGISVLVLLDEDETVSGTICSREPSSCFSGSPSWWGLADEAIEVNCFEPLDLTCVLRPKGRDTWTNVSTRKANLKMKESLKGLYYKTYERGK